MVEADKTISSGIAANKRKPSQTSLPALPDGASLSCFAGDTSPAAKPPTSIDGGWLFQFNAGFGHNPLGYFRGLCSLLGLRNYSQRNELCPATNFKSSGVERTGNIRSRRHAVPSNTGLEPAGTKAPLNQHSWDDVRPALVTFPSQQPVCRSKQMGNTNYGGSSSLAKYASKEPAVRGFDFAEKLVRFQSGPLNPRKDCPQGSRNVAGPVVAMEHAAIEFLPVRFGQV